MMFKFFLTLISIFLPLSVSAGMGQIFIFKDLITLDENLKNSPNAVYIKEGKFIKIDKFNKLINDFPDSKINRNYENNIAVPGFIEHHIHPFLSSLTMNSTIISIDDWNLDGKTRYEAMIESHHDHLIDIKSGEIIEFVDEEIEKLQKKVADKYGYDLVDHKLE